MPRAITTPGSLEQSVPPACFRAPGLLLVLLGLLLGAALWAAGCASGGTVSSGPRASANPGASAAPMASAVANPGASAAPMASSAVSTSTSTARATSKAMTRPASRPSSPTTNPSTITVQTAKTAEDSAPAFESSVHRISDTLKAEMVRSGSWRSGDPVTIEELGLIEVSFWGFDGKAHTGSLVVNARWAVELCGVFRTLYEARFPIRSMNLIDVYGADDERSMAADNTSAYNGRYVSGTTSWSMHAYGLAVDINPVENPWVRASVASPSAGAPYADRSLRTPGMIHGGDVVVRAFASIGWKWGGSWSGSKDYQHFSSDGK